MAQFAMWSQSTVITLSPGEVHTYRLPTMTPGIFHLTAMELPGASNMPHTLANGPTPAAPKPQAQPILRNGPALTNIPGTIATNVISTGGGIGGIGGVGTGTVGGGPGGSGP